MSRWIVAGILVIAASQTPTSALQSPALTRCAEAAAAWWNGKVGIPFDEIKAADAIRLCEAATRAASPSPDAWAFLARALAKAERYSEMRAAIDRAVAGGSAAGLWYRGVMYEQGHEVAQNAAEAAKWYTQAAERGDPNAQLSLARMHFQGTLGPGEKEKVVPLLRRAAEQGHPEAQFQLGLMLQDYSAGVYDVEKAQREAAQWFERAGRLGHPDARLNLGIMYAEGRGVEKDANKALSYLQALEFDNKELKEEVIDLIIALIPSVRDVPLLVALMRDENPEIRRSAALSLGFVTDSRSFPTLSAAVSDRDPAVRVAVAATFGFLKDQRAIPILTKMLKDEQPGVIESAASALRQFGSQTASTLLENARDARGPARIAILKAAADGGAIDERVLEGLLAGLNDQNPTARRMAAEGLAKTADLRAVPPLVARLRDPDAQVRKASLGALRFLGDRPAFDALVPLLSDSDEIVRHDVIQALSEMGDSRAVEPLIRKLADSEDRRAAMTALGSLRDARAVEPLIALLNDRNDGERSAQALGRIGDVRAIPPIIAALKARDRADRPDFWRAIGMFSGEAANRLVLEALQKDDSLWFHAPRSLAKMAGTDMVESLLALLSDRSAKVREGVVDTLGGIGDRRSVDPLIKCLGDPEENVREAAAKALGELGDAAAVEPLIARLRNDTGKLVREKAAVALGHLKDARAVEPLITTLEDEHMSPIAVLALTEIGDRRATKGLVAALSSSSSSLELRLFIVGALEKLEDPDSVDALLGLLKDPRSGLRDVAALALGKVHDDRAVQPLLGLMGTAGDLRRAVIRALGMLGDRRAAPALVAAASNAEEDRAAAAFSLFQLKDPRGLDLLIGLLDDPELRNEATMLLAETRDPRAVEPLAKQMQARTDGGEGLALGAILALGAPPNPRVHAFVASRPRLARVVISAADRFQPGLVELADAAGATAADAVLLDLIEHAWDWQGDRAKVDGELLKIELPELRADAATPTKGRSPFGYLMASRLHASNKNWTHALSYAERGLAETPRRLTALRVALSWLKIESQWLNGSADAALLTLDDVEKELLPSLDPYERRKTGLPLDSYTHFLRGAALLTLNRHQAALQELDKADQALRVEAPRWLEEYTVERQRRLIHSYRNSAGIAVSLANLRRSAADAVQIQGAFEKAPAATVIEQEAQRVNLEAAIQALMADAATSPVALERAQALADQLQLKGQQLPPDLRPADPARRAAMDELLAQRKTLGQLDRQVAALRSRQDSAARAGQDSAAKPDNQDKEEKDLTALRLEQAAARKTFRDFLIKLKREHPEVAALIGAEPTDVKALQPRLGPGMRLLQYVLLDNQGWAFVVGPTDIQFVEIGIGRLKLKPIVERYRALIQDPRVARGLKTPGTTGSSETEARGLAASLSKWLLSPLESLLQGVTSLIVVPNGPLHQLPFAALPWRDGYLIQAFELRFLSKTSLLAAVIDKPTTSTGTLILGNPASPDPVWRPLPEAEAEAIEIAAMFPGAHALVGAAAKRSALVGQDLTGHIVHLALHGQAGRLENTRLVLSDGYLTVSDVGGLSLQDAPLVVLSACETALGQQLSGDEFVSLADGFLFAGSRAVIATLWPVEDASTRQLMTSFYRGRTGGTAKALADAQRALIAKGYGPYHWAAFVLNGW